MEYARQIIEGIGLEPERLQMINISSAMAGEFSESASEITETIQALGPSPLRSKEAARSKAQAEVQEAE